MLKLILSVQLSGKPRPQPQHQSSGEQPQANARNAGVGGGGNTVSGNSHSRQHRKDGVSPTSTSSSNEVSARESLLGPAPVTTNSSSPFGSVKKGKVPTTAQSRQTEHAQRDAPKRKGGKDSSGSGTATAEPTTQQVVIINYNVVNKFSVQIFFFF